MKAPALLGYRGLPEIPVSQALSALKETSIQQSKMVDPCGSASRQEPSQPAVLVFGAHAPLAVSAAFSPSSLPYTPPCLITAECSAASQCLSWMSHSSCLSKGEELQGFLQEIMAILHLLPTKQDLQYLILAGEGQAAQGGREEMAALITDRDYSEPRQETNHHMLTLMADCSQASQPAHIGSLALPLEDMEEWAPMITTEISDLSEAPGSGDSQDTILSFSNKVLLCNPLALFNVTSALTALELWPRGLSKSRDANILQQSWAPRALDFVRPPGYTLPDYPRDTLQSRVILKPPLLKLRENGATYRWGILYYLSPVAADFGRQSPHPVVDRPALLKRSPPPIGRDPY